LQGVLQQANPKASIVDIQHADPQHGARPYRIHLALAPTKNIDRTEWLLEKAVELGVDEVSFLLCAHSERKQLKLERLEKIALSAAKQSLKATIPLLHPLQPLSEWIKNQPADSQQFIAHLVEGEERLLLQKALQPNGSYTILIGPEGDFSPEEIATALAAGFRPVSLGDSRLRTETAALVAVHLCHVAQQL
jgi:16S rRNA (uracil1498-N3)-methyltransferase